MTPIQHAHYSHLPPSEGGHGRQVYLHPFLPTYETSSFPRADLFMNPIQAASSGSDHQHSHHRQQEANQQFPSRGSTHHGSLLTTAPATKDDESSSKNMYTRESDPSSSTTTGAPSRWVSSKMRFVRKMMDSDSTTSSGKPRKSTLELQDQHQSLGGANNNHCLPGGAPVRVCSDCNTTKTPLWRSGPRGPKSLCNACGIRQRKARRAAMAAAALTGGLIPAVAPAAKVPKEKRADGAECGVPFKKRCKFTSAADQTGKELHVIDEFTMGFSKNSAFHRVFPQDEKEAALLLMALSCGLIRG